MAQEPLSEFDLEAAWKSVEAPRLTTEQPSAAPSTVLPTPLVRDALRRQYAGVVISLAITLGYLYVLAITPSWILRGGIGVLVLFNMAVMLRMIPLIRRMRSLRMDQPLRQFAQGLLADFKNWHRFQNYWAGVAFPVAAMTGFFLGGTIGAQEPDASVLLQKPKLLLTALGVTLAIIPLAYRLSRWMWKHSYQKDVNRLEDWLKDLS
jgi:membrane protein YdbS with pleckstrin-like domain